MNPKIFNVKDEKGSITLFVVIAILFFLIILFGRVYSTSNINTSQVKEIERIEKQYSVTDDDLDRAYKEAIKQEYQLKVGDFVRYELSALDNTKVTTLASDVETYSGRGAQTISRQGTTETIGEKEYLLCRVLEIDKYGNPSKLISADGVNSLNLGGADGYNNAVYLINEMCETLYSGNQGTTTSLKIEDLENNFNSDGLNERDTFNMEGYTYGETIYYENAQYPNIAPEEAKMGIGTTLVDGKNQIRTGGLGLSQQDKIYTGSGNVASLDATRKGITVTQTFYASIKSEIYNKVNNENVYYNIFHQSPTANGSSTTGVSSYWLASRCVCCRNTSLKYCSFLVRNVQSSTIGSCVLFQSYYNNSQRRKFYQNVAPRSFSKLWNPS